MKQKWDAKRAAGNPEIGEMGELSCASGRNKNPSRIAADGFPAR
jgi:hypothetical protein